MFCFLRKTQKIWNESRFLRENLKSSRTQTADKLFGAFLEGRGQEQKQKINRLKEVGTVLKSSVAFDVWGPNRRRGWSSLRAVEDFELLCFTNQIDCNRQVLFFLKESIDPDILNIWRLPHFQGA